MYADFHVLNTTPPSAGLLKGGTRESKTASQEVGRGEEDPPPA
jgi:hypothetical protein